MYKYYKVAKELPQICNDCGTKKNLIIHHRDLGRTTSNKKDLEILCRSCHFKRHYRQHNRTKGGQPKLDNEEERKAKDRIRALEKYYGDLPPKIKCELCGSNKRLEYHHTSYDENKEIKIWCKSCHLSYHKSNPEKMGVDIDNRKCDTEQKKKMGTCIFCRKRFRYYVKSGRKGLFCSQTCNMKLQQKIRSGQIIAHEDNKPLLDYLNKRKFQERFEIEIGVDEDKLGFIIMGGNHVGDKYATAMRKDIEPLAKRDGFKSAKEMFKYFDDKYDLSSPKKFYVYRSKYL